MFHAHARTRTHQERERERHRCCCNVLIANEFLSFSTAFLALIDAVPFLHCCTISWVVTIKNCSSGMCISVSMSFNLSRLSLSPNFVCQIVYSLFHTLNRHLLPKFNSKRTFIRIFQSRINSNVVFGISISKRLVSDHVNSYSTRLFQWLTAK